MNPLDDRGVTSTVQPGSDLRAEPKSSSDVALAMETARDHLLSIQHEDGHWRGELEGGSILQSQYILLKYFIGEQEGAKVAKAAERLRRTQRPEGGWSVYPGGPADVSASVEAYFVLKLLGDQPNAPHMERARRAIVGEGGIRACNSFTKICLAVFGQIDWNRCPAVPPEMVLLPSNAPLNIYTMSSWSRTIFVPLSIIWSTKPHCPVPSDRCIPEIDVEMPATAELQRWNERLWKAIFVGTDLALKGIERLPAKPLRARALKKAEAWILTRLENSDGLGAIFPPIVNTIMALRCLGYETDHPVIREQLRELERLEIEEPETLRLQPCQSPVWDTGQALNVLSEAGCDISDPRLLRAARWLLEREIRIAGDWKVQVSTDVEPGGWSFEFENQWYPDCDDTTIVITALAKIRFEDEAADSQRRRAIERGVRWLLAMQNSDGGWASFDRNCNLEVLTYVPFADHNAMIDPSNEDITGRLLETLRMVGVPPHHPAVKRAVAYLSRMQDEDGCWYGRWGVNYIYGTWLVLTGLQCAGLGPTDERIERAARWLRSVQNDDGGWGESPRSYDDPASKGRGVSTAAQTSWAILGLIAAGEGDSHRIRSGVAWLLKNQYPDGSWFDDQWTGTGFPRVFYLRYHMYAIYFPLLALAAFDKVRRGLEAQPWSDHGTDGDSV